MAKIAANRKSKAAATQAEAGSSKGKSARSRTRATAEHSRSHGAADDDYDELEAARPRKKTRRTPGDRRAREEEEDEEQEGADAVKRKKEKGKGKAAQQDQDEDEDEEEEEEEDEDEDEEEEEEEDEDEDEEVRAHIDSARRRSQLAKSADPAAKRSRGASSNVKRKEHDRTGTGEQPRKKSRGGTSEVVLSDADQAPREGSADYGGVTIKWESSVLRLRTEAVKVDAEQEQAARELAAARIGSAHLRFCGLNDVYSNVNLDEDPNARGNPRGLSISHVNKLHQAVRHPNGKKDHEAPIAIAVPRRLLSPKLVEAMQKSEATDILSQPPALVLLSPTSEEESKLENEHFLLRRGDEWLSTEELYAIKERLDELRSAKEKAKLYNGNHRIRAMLKCTDEVIKLRGDMRTLIEKGETPPEEIEEMMEDILDRAERLTWRCHVYDADKLTPAAASALTKNEHSRPAKGMEGGEKVWWTAQKFYGEIAAEMAKGTEEDPVDRPAAAGLVQGRWRGELGMKMSMTGQDEEAEDDKQAKFYRQNKQIGDLVGKDTASRLFFSSAGMEMMLECCPALWAIGKTLERSAAIEMLRPSGGPLIAHFWLSLQTLIHIFNVADGEEIQKAEEYLATNPKVAIAGDPAAAPFYQSLHVRPLRVPPLLSLFEDKQSAKFGDLYTKAMAPHMSKLKCLDYRDEKVVASLRGVFEAFGKYMESETVMSKRLVAASIRLYARLPLYKIRGEGPMFYPAATLPSLAINKSIYERWAGGWGVGTAGNCLVVLEELFQRSQIVWTVGSLGTNNTSNWSNWYYRSRGLHQIVMLLWEAVELGSVEARLSEAIMIFEDPRLSMALHRVDELMGKRKDLKTAIKEFSAQKTGPWKYNGARKVFDTYGTHLGPWADFENLMADARKDLKAAIQWEQSPSQLSIKAVLQQHDVLELIHPSFWDQAFPKWFQGWRDDDRKRMGTVAMGLGWGLLDRWLVDLEMPELFLDEKVRWLLGVAQHVLELTSRKSWWDNRYDVVDLPLPPTELTEKMLGLSKQALRAIEAEKRKAETKKAKEEKKAAAAAAAAAAADLEDEADDGAYEEGGKGTGKGGSKKSKGKGSMADPNRPSTRSTAGVKSGAGASTSTSRGGAQDPKSSEMIDTQVDLEADKDYEMGLRPTDEGSVPDPPETTVAPCPDRRFMPLIEVPAPPEHVSSRVKLGDKDRRDLDPRTLPDIGIPLESRVGLYDGGSGLPPAGRGFEYHHLAPILPLHVHAPAVSSLDIPHNAWRQLGMVRDLLHLEGEGWDTAEQLLHGALKKDPDAMIRVLQAFGQERRKLRDHMLEICKTTREIGLDAVQVLLTDSLDGAKDMFMVRCAKILKSEMKIPLGEAVHEVARMVASDQLYTRPSIYVTEDGNYRLDLTATFSKGAQPKVEKRAQMNLFDDSEISPPDPDTMQALQYIKPIRGLGRTTKESRERAFEAVEDAQIARDLNLGAPYAVHGLVPDLDTAGKVSLKEDRQVSGRQPINNPRERNVLWQDFLPSPVPTNCPSYSPFSTGEFFPEARDKNKYVRDPENKDLMELVTERRAAYDTAWKQCVLDERRSYDEYLADIVPGYVPEQSQASTIALTAQTPRSPLATTQSRSKLTLSPAQSEQVVEQAAAASRQVPSVPVLPEQPKSPSRVAQQEGAEKQTETSGVPTSSQSLGGSPAKGNVLAPDSSPQRTRSVTAVGPTRRKAVTPTRSDGEREREDESGSGEDSDVLSPVRKIVASQAAPEDDEELSPDDASQQFYTPNDAAQNRQTSIPAAPNPPRIDRSTGRASPALPLHRK
ncbi:hypothetical protein FRC09_003516 [Ceratobasidium sp. 395]|nr:hypothetical protein FRC09_003516 [Ceratobasidium sp. 395]